MANESARQVLFIITAISIAVSVLCLGFKKPLLRLIFGSVEADVMRASETYFFYTAISFPFIAAYDSAAFHFSRAGEYEGSNAHFHDIECDEYCWKCNYDLDFPYGSCGCGNFYTGLPYILCSGSIDSIKKRPAANRGKSLPENPSGLGNDPENTRNRNSVRCGKQYVPAWETGDTVYRINIRYNSNRSTGNDKYSGESEWNGGNRNWCRLMTIVGQCMGADRKDEAVYYIKKLSVIAEVAIIVSCLLVFALTGPVTVLGGMEPASAKMCFHMVIWITIVKPIVWTLAFVPAYGLRAAGDVKFSMITSCLVMWLCRFCLCVILIRFLGFGPMGVWIGMFADWTVRAVIFTWRFHSRRWLRYKVI